MNWIPVSGSEHALYDGWIALSFTEDYIIVYIMVGRKIFDTRFFRRFCKSGNGHTYDKCIEIRG